MPIEKGGYRAWKGKPKGLAHRIFSIANCELRYRLKRPAIIVVLAMLGLYTLITGLVPIMSTLFEGENIFVSDPNLDFNQYQVPDIKVTGVSVSNTSDTLELFDLGLEPGQTAVYQLEISNIGTRSGSFNVILSTNSGTNAWNVELLEGSIPLERRGDDQPDVSVDDIGARTRQYDEKRPPSDAFPDTYGDNYQSDISLDLEPNSPKTVSLKVSLDEDTISFDTMALSLSVNNNIDWFEYDEDSAAYYQAKIRFDLFTKIAWPAKTLKPILKVELAGVKDISGTWSEDRMKNIYDAPPQVKWDDKLEYTFRVTNKGDETIFVKCSVDRYSYYEPVFYYDFDEYNYEIEYSSKLETYFEEIKEIKSGETETFTITETANIGEAPVKRYPQWIFMASNRGESFDEDVLQSFSEGVGAGKNLSFVSVPYKVSSYQLPVDDETADYFFNTFYTGGINGWVILLAVLAGSGLIADDRANKTLPLYYSKAIPKYGYLAGKFLGLAAIIALVTVVLSNLWFTVIMLVGGFSWEFFTSHIWIMGAFTLYGLIITFFMTSLVLAASSLAKNRYIVGASVFAMFLITSILSFMISDVTGEENYLMLSPSVDLFAIGYALFDLGTPLVDWGYALMTLAGAFIIFMGVLYWQLIRREVSIE